MNKRLLEFVQIEYVTSPAQSEGVPWAVVAVDHESPDDRILIHEVQGCSTWIADYDRDYLDAILLDWRMTINRNGPALLDSLKDLAIGPLRTRRFGVVPEEELGNI